MVLGPLFLLLILVGLEALLHVGVTEERVVVEGHLRIDGFQCAVLEKHERVDLHEGGIFLHEELIESLENLSSLLHLSFVIEELPRSLVGLEVGHADGRVNDDLHDLLRCFFGNLLDIHAAGAREHHHRALRLTVDEDRDIIFGGDVDCLGDEHTVHSVAFDLHAEDSLRILADFFLTGSELHTTGFTTATGMNLCFHHCLRAAELAVGFHGLIRSTAKEVLVYWHAILLEEAFGLIFMYFHNNISLWFAKIFVCCYCGAGAAPALPPIRAEREERQAIVAPEVTDLEVAEAVTHGDGLLDIRTDDIDRLVARVIARHPEMAGGSFVEDLVGTCNFEALDITVT